MLVLGGQGHGGFAGDPHDCVTFLLQEALQAQREKEAGEEAGARADLADRLAELRLRKQQQQQQPQLAEAA